mmetsp:Transcript_46155/g.68082  ORF Transcript_46155/g.68082 Transcript_46155/m.68082 type:complete len:421 (-) Transcript_46155:558-1820(-)
MQKQRIQNYAELTDNAHGREEMQKQRIQGESGSHLHHQGKPQPEVMNISVDTGNNRMNNRNGTNEHQDAKEGNTSTQILAKPTFDDEPNNDTGDERAVSSEKQASLTKPATNNQPNKDKDAEQTQAIPKESIQQKEALDMIPDVQKRPLAQYSNSNKRKRVCDDDSIAVYNKTSGFILKTFKMINKCDPNICCWSDDGDSFTVKDQAKLAELHISKFFSHANFSSFTRQLNFYGFCKKFSEDAFDTKNKKESANYVIYNHTYFHRDHPERLHFIRRSTKEIRESETALEVCTKQLIDLGNKISHVEPSLYSKIDAKIDSASSDLETKIGTVQRYYDEKTRKIISHYDGKISALISHYDGEIARLASQFDMRIAHAMTQVREARRNRLMRAPSTFFAWPSTAQVQKPPSSLAQEIKPKMEE